MIPLSLFLLALALRVAVLAVTGFDGLYGRDAYAYWQHGIQAADAARAGFSPPGEYAFPQGFPVMVGASVLAFGERLRAVQLLVAVLGACVAPLTYALTRSLLPGVSRTGAVTAGAVVAVSGEAILSSVAIMSDTPALFWAAVAALALSRAWNGRLPGWRLLVAGLLLGAAVITRWSYALVTPAFLGFAALMRRRTRRPGWGWFLLPVLGGTAIVWPEVRAALSEPVGLLHPLLREWTPLNAFRATIDTSTGTYAFPVPVGLFYAQAFGHPAFVFPLLGVLGVWGAWRLVARERVAAVLLLTWIGVVFLFLAGIPWQNFRFGLMFLVPWAVVIGAGAAALCERSRMWRFAVVACLALTVPWAFRTCTRFVERADRDKDVVHAVDATLPPDTALLVFEITPAFAHYHPERRPIELYYQSEAKLESLLLTHERVALLADPDRITRLWNGRRPHDNLTWLRANAEVVPRDTLGTFVLFDVNRRDK